MFRRLIIALALGAAVLALATLSHARNYIPDSDPAVRAWYSTLLQPDVDVSCCGPADAYWADSFEVDKDGHYVAIVTDDRDVPGRPEIAIGTRVAIPDTKLPNPTKQRPNPTGHGIVFVAAAEDYVVFCYFPPGGV